MSKIIPDILKKWYWLLLIPIFIIVTITILMLSDGYYTMGGIWIVLSVVFTIFWCCYSYYQQQSYRIEYGEGKIVVCRISGEFEKAFCKRRKDFFM